MSITAFRDRYKWIVDFYGFMENLEENAYNLRKYIASNDKGYLQVSYFQMKYFLSHTTFHFHGIKFLWIYESKHY